MASVLLLLLIITSLSMIVWGLWEKDRIYQFPTLAGVAWLGYIVPQAIGVWSNPRSVPARALSDGGLELALAMTTLCAGLSFWGYLKVPHHPSAPQPRGNYSHDRLFAFGCLLYLVAYLASYRLAQLCGGYVAYYWEGGAYSLQWRGLPVAYAFFAALVFPGLLLCLVAALHGRSQLKWCAVGVGCILPLANTIFLGRRQNTVVLLLILAVTLFFVRRWTPPRPVAIVAMILGALAIVVAPAYRANLLFGNHPAPLRNIDLRQRVADKLQGRSTWVFENAVTQMAAVNRAGEYGMGRGMYNRFIMRLVPRLLVEDEIKEGLLLPGPDHRDLTWRYYRWVTKYGTYSTGACDVFREFWFFGALLFYFMGRLFRTLWERAYVRDRLPAQLMYVSTCVVAMTSVANNVAGIPVQLAVIVAVLFPTIALSCVGPRGDLVLRHDERAGLGPHHFVYDSTP